MDACGQYQGKAYSIRSPTTESLPPLPKAGGKEAKGWGTLSKQHLQQGRVPYRQPLKAGDRKSRVPLARFVLRLCSAYAWCSLTPPGHPQREPGSGSDVEEESLAL